MLSDRLRNLIYLLPVLSIVAFYIFKSYDYQIHDFANYYLGAQAILNDTFTSDIYNALYCNQLVQSTNIDKLFINFYPNTPFIAISYLPLANLDWQEAKLIHNILGGLLFLLALYHLFTYYKIKDWKLGIALLIFIVAIKNNLLFGQTYFYIFFLLAEGLILYEKKYKCWASLLWSLAILIKVFPLIILFWLFFKKDYTTIFNIVVTCALLILGSSLLIDKDTLTYYFVDVFPSSSGGLIYDGFTVRAKSAIMLFKNAFVEDTLLNPNPIINSSLLFAISYSLYKAIIFSVAASATISNRKHILYSFSIWMIAGLLIAPTSSSYVKLLLIIPIFLLFRDKVKTSTLAIISALIIFICNFPSNYLYDLPLPFNFIKVLVLLVVFLLMSRIYTFKFSYLWLGLFITLFTIQGLYKNNPQTTFEYVDIGHMPPLIMSKINVESGNLNYYYWDIDGEKKEKTEIKVSSYSSDVVRVINNQLHFKNKQLTNSHDSKRSPYLINDSTIIFLTDSGRAPGCYTIRKLNL